jgi:hypothetical protein
MAMRSKHPYAIGTNWVLSRLLALVDRLTVKDGNGWRVMRRIFLW